MQRENKNLIFLDFQVHALVLSLIEWMNFLEIVITLEK